MNVCFVIGLGTLPMVLSKFTLKYFASVKWFLFRYLFTINNVKNAKKMGIKFIWQTLVFIHYATSLLRGSSKLYWENWRKQPIMVLQRWKEIRIISHNFAMHVKIKSVPICVKDLLSRKRLSKKLKEKIKSLHFIIVLM